MDCHVAFSSYSLSFILANAVQGESAERFRSSSQDSRLIEREVGPASQQQEAAVGCVVCKTFQSIYSLCPLLPLLVHHAVMLIVFPQAGIQISSRRTSESQTRLGMLASFGP